MKVPILVGGERIKTGEEMAVIFPLDGSEVSKVYMAGDWEIERAIERALKAFPVMRELSSYEKERILLNVADKLEKRKEEFAETITLEAGKPIKLSRAEVERAILTLRTAAEEAKRIGGELIDLDVTGTSDRFAITKRFPIGPVLGITPFNFPLNLVAHKVAPSIAAGNPIVIKPGPQTPLSALKLGDLFYEAGLPEGALSIVPTTNERAEKMVRDERFELLSFTGSAKVGWYLKGICGRKRVVLELGGNAGVIVDRDSDISLSAKQIVRGAFAYAGQSCISVQRVYADYEIFENLKEEILKEAEKVRVGDPRDPEVDVGPMIRESEAQRALEWIEEAISKGANLVKGGKRKGSILYPTILENVSRETKMWREEIFAPVFMMNSYGDFKEAIKFVNDSDYGLQAGIFSRNMERVLEAFYKLDVGGVIVNDISTTRIDPMPYGGIKKSGLGREGIRYAIEEMTEIKILLLRKPSGK